MRVGDYVPHVLHSWRLTARTQKEHAPGYLYLYIRTMHRYIYMGYNRCEEAIREVGRDLAVSTTLHDLAVSRCGDVVSSSLIRRKEASPCESELRHVAAPCGRGRHTIQRRLLRSAAVNRELVSALLFSLSLVPRPDRVGWLIRLVVAPQVVRREEPVVPLAPKPAGQELLMGNVAHFSRTSSTKRRRCVSPIPQHRSGRSRVIPPSVGSASRVSRATSVGREQQRGERPPVGQRVPVSMAPSVARLVSRARLCSVL